jgi:ATP-binding cassette, subfamily B, bacterial
LEHPHPLQIEMARPKTIRDSLQRFWALMRHFRPALREERRVMIASLLALALSVAFQLLEPWPLKMVLDVTNPHKSRPGRHIPQMLQSLTGPQLIALAAIGLVTVVTLRATFDYLNSLGFSLIGNRAVARVRADLYRHLQSLPLSFHTQARAGDLLLRVTDDIKLLRDVSVTTILPLIGSVLVLVGMVVVMLLVNWQLALLAMLVLPMFTFSTVRIGRRIHQTAREQRQREGALAASAAEAISAVHVVQALSLEGHFEAGFTKQNRKSTTEGIMSQRLSAKLERTTDILIAFATAIVLGVGGSFALSGKILASDLIVFLFYMKRGFRPMQDFAKYAARLAKATAAGERIVELLEITPDIADAPDSVPAPRIAGGLEFNQIQFGYRPGVHVFDDLQLKVEPGQFVAIVGSSGAGKSTLLNLLMRMYEPAVGEVRIDGQDIRKWTLASLRSQISIVLQDTVLFAGNVYENIALGAAGVSKEQIEAAVRLAEAHEFVSALPNGYETTLGERGVNLSHGQRQRISIARAAVRDAPILLLDEPTTGLDEENERLVRSALARLAEGRTTLWITHDLRDIRNADVIAFVEAGRILETGTHEQLLAKGGRYATMFRLQSGTLPASSDRDRRVAI